MTYWSKRTLREREASIKKGEAEFKKELEELYSLQLSQLRKELDAYIQKFANKTGLSVSDAKRKADSFDVKDFETKAKQYVANKDFSPKANRELRDYNFSMSVGRQELLIQELELELLALSEGERKLTEDYLKNGYKSEIARESLLDQTVPRGKTLEKYMNTAVNANFEGAKWSERIWNSQEKLRKLVKNEVTRALIRGENGLTIARKIRKYMDASRFEAERLGITEHARVQTLAQQVIMKDNGFKRFKLMPESRACDICKTIGKETEKNPVIIADMEIGTNAPPIHPYCRCAVVEVE
ncbi:putative minor head protein [Streptococcus phage TP-J34]|uniref:Putative minor head protein n=1 Tax=Streptococcus phage TP-J34 TaxID=73422 RepID=L0P379_9CAUD|nr:minor head protein [Streptococcus phage TP-J34]CCI71964.1 putative minor head protein [Streptococcus phage TP-J34]